MLFLIDLIMFWARRKKKRNCNGNRRDDAGYELASDEDFSAA